MKKEEGSQIYYLGKEVTKEKPLVTIITVVLNGEKYIEQAIQSVVNQTYSNIEYIVIDGGSTDGTIDIIKKYEKFIDYWVSEKDKGLYDAMNKGIKLSHGEIIGLLNSDDFYEKETVEVVVSKFNYDSEIMLVHGAIRNIDSSGKVDSVYGSMEGISDFLSIPFNHPTCFFKKEFYNRFGIFDLTFPTAADYDLMLRFKKNKLKDLYVDRVFTNFRRVGVTSVFRLSQLSEIWFLLKKNKYSFLHRIYAIAYRLFFMFVVKVLSVPKLTFLKRKMRKYLSYQKLIDSK